MRPDEDEDDDEEPESPVVQKPIKAAGKAKKTKAKA
jgi:hypothetical protein